jgi:hypothetical protein
MAGNNVLANRRQLAFDNMQVRPANTASPHTQQDVSRLQFRLGNFGNPKGSLRNVLRRCQHGSFHGIPLG